MGHLPLTRVTHDLLIIYMIVSLQSIYIQLFLATKKMVKV